MQTMTLFISTTGLFELRFFLNADSGLPFKVRVMGEIVTVVRVGVANFLKLCV